MTNKNSVPITGKTTIADMELISDIVKRIMGLLDEVAGTRRDSISWFMDVEIVHNNDGLRLQDLLDADQYDFTHDLIGIANHLNRETGQLEDCFSPRYTAYTKEAE